jgi:hypothetical protein
VLVVAEWESLLSMVRRRLRWQCTMMIRTGLLAEHSVERESKSFSKSWSASNANDTVSSASRVELSHIDGGSGRKDILRSRAVAGVEVFDQYWIVHVSRPDGEGTPV